MQWCGTVLPVRTIMVIDLGSVPACVPLAVTLRSSSNLGIACHGTFTNSCLGYNKQRAGSVHMSGVLGHVVPCCSMPCPLWLMCSKNSGQLLLDGLLWVLGGGWGSPIQGGAGLRTTTSSRSSG